MKAYDPKANGEAKAELRRGIAIVETYEEAVKSTDAVFIATEWPEFLQIDLNKLKGSVKGKLFVDSVNGFSIEEVENSVTPYEPGY